MKRGGEVTGGDERRSSCRGAWQRNPGDGRRARLSAWGDRLPSSLLISAFNKLNNRLARAYRLGTAVGGCGVKELFRQWCQLLRDGKGIAKRFTVIYNRFFPLLIHSCAMYDLLYSILKNKPKKTIKKLLRFTQTLACCENKNITMSNAITSPVIAVILVEVRSWVS